MSKILDKLKCLKMLSKDYEGSRKSVWFLQIFILRFIQKFSSQVQQGQGDEDAAGGGEEGEGEGTGTR